MNILRSKPNAPQGDNYLEKIHRPDKYGGDKEALRPFLTGMDLYFSKKAPRYTTDISKVEKVYKFLKDKA